MAETMLRDLIVEGSKKLFEVHTGDSNGKQSTALCYFLDKGNHHIRINLPFDDPLSKKYLQPLTAAEIIAYNLNRYEFNQNYMFTGQDKDRLTIEDMTEAMHGMKNKYSRAVATIDTVQLINSNIRGLLTGILHRCEKNGIKVNDLVDDVNNHLNQSDQFVERLKDVR